ncbi:terpene cyclase/mutase family protein [Fictibacillus phosphorivorans]|uniref:terpene cyclase/mutase family protein n=1 Tax=Fictibacillus phosphorivorans TaxID=1221500 RepID=UPI00204228E8|nr:prenyltransferase/squalene oxidase repeat-containing protein [Fictibacillus phosphorivorans]MCM3776478.1 squalene--hopene cyclase [Fictibacillus phosphorivorans]
MDIRKIEIDVHKRCNELLSMQKPDGTWRFCFENPLITDAYMLILLRTLEYRNEKIIKQITDRIRSQQSPDGLWRVYSNEEPANLSATIQAYTALLYSRYYKSNDDKLQPAREFIIKNGGLKEADLITKVFLAMNGLYMWPDVPIDPAILFSLPLTAPINQYDISSYARGHFAPVLLMMDAKKKLTSKYTPDLSELYINGDESSQLEEWVNLFSLLNIRDYYSQLKKENLLSYIQSHIEPDGTLLSYSLTTIFMIYALLTNGYSRDSDVIQNAMNSLMKMFCETDETLHLQNSPSTTWDTSLILYTLLEAGVPVNHTSILRGSQFLLNQQHTKYGDWAVHNPNVLPGGWGFSIGNTIHPDIDDTQAALRTVAHFYQMNPSYQTSYERGLTWLLSMQNDDGGWAAFEKNTNRFIIGNLPIKYAKDALIDPSTPDLTGRTIEFLGRFHGLNYKHPSIKKAVNWLWQNQEQNGSWYGRWGVCYLYGTWAAITGLIASGIDPTHNRVQKAKNWLLSIQNDDGGWGESCESDEKRKYVALKESTPSQTAWALNALTVISDQPTFEMKRAAEWLLNHKKTNYPTGAGLPGAFYIRYHSYPYIWPLLGLVHFYKKFTS